MEILIIIIVLCVSVGFFYKNLKKIDIDCVYLITGAPKTGKTLLSVSNALRLLKIQRLKYYFKKYILFKKNLEKPLLYSNIPLFKVNFVPLTFDMIFRKVRFNYGSVVLIDEVSLLADSMDYSDEEVNTALKEFVKLFGHETKGGYLIVDTQSLKDCHFAFKRCIGSFLYIAKKHKLPFIPWVTLNVREMVNIDESTINVVNGDVDKVSMSGFMKFRISKRIFKKYDYCCYSILTDNLPIANDTIKVVKRSDLKTSHILSLKNFIRNKNNKKNNNKVVL